MTSPEPYERRLLQADDATEVLVMTWRPGATCAPHDHGLTSGGVVHLVVGALVERRYRFDGHGLAMVAEARYDAPAVLTVEPGVVHDMRAIGKTTTVHVYQPRVASMRVYDAAARTTWIVHDAHGAWLPRADAAAVVAERWIVP